MSVKEQMTEALNLPKDLTLGAVILTITGKHEAYVENYMSLIEYTENQIRIQTRTCKLEIHGKQLEIVYYTNEEMKITGELLEVKYC
ncbi:MAG: YabP/YqfC family sporulation protein [Anaerosacchariphilus sp.]